MDQAVSPRLTNPDNNLVAVRGEILLARLGKSSPAPLSDLLYNGIIDLATGGEHLKVALFRFVDTLPSLKSPEAVTQHLEQYLAHQDDALPPHLTKILLALGSLPPQPRAVARMSEAKQHRLKAGQVMPNSDRAVAVVTAATVSTGMFLTAATVSAIAGR